MKLAARKLIAAMALLPVLHGCTGIGYYAKSLNGHLEIMGARQKVDKLAADPAQPDKLRSQMRLAADIRRFAVDSLGLPDNKSYTSYVDTGRDYVTIAVFAAPELSLTPIVWCFPVFGCVPYRGFFSREDARKQAQVLREQGNDVHVTGVTAYSTLGWTSDPLLNTMFRGDEAFLAGLVFHELAHQRLYVRNDTAFNEAFAVAVEMTGVRKWLTARGDAEGLARYEASEARARDFLQLVTETRTQLAAIYAGSGTDAEKRAAKAAAIEQLRARYRAVRDRRWGGFAGYDGWFDADINNAKLAATAVYGDQVPVFMALFARCGGSHQRFYAAVERLATVEKARRGAALAAATTCP